MYTVYIVFTKSKSSFVWPNQRTWSNSEVVQRDFTEYSLQLISLISWDCRHFSISFIFQLGPAFCSLFFFCVCVCVSSYSPFKSFFFSLLFLPLFSHVLFPARTAVIFTLLSCFQERSTGFFSRLPSNAETFEASLLSLAWHANWLGTSWEDAGPFEYWQSGCGGSGYGSWVRRVWEGNILDVGKETLVVWTSVFAWSSLT